MINPVIVCLTLFHQKNTVSFLQECASRNVSNFSALVDQLNVEEMTVVRQAVTKGA
jgi:importin-9